MAFVGGITAIGINEKSGFSASEFGSAIGLSGDEPVAAGKDEKGVGVRGGMRVVKVGEDFVSVTFGAAHNGGFHQKVGVVFGPAAFSGNNAEIGEKMGEGEGGGRILRGDGGVGNPKEGGYPGIKNVFTKLLGGEGLENRIAKKISKVEGAITATVNVRRLHAPEGFEFGKIVVAVGKGVVGFGGADGNKGKEIALIFGPVGVPKRVAVFFGGDEGQAHRPDLNVGGVGKTGGPPAVGAVTGVGGVFGNFGFGFTNPGGSGGNFTGKSIAGEKFSGFATVTHFFDFAAGRDKFGDFGGNAGTESGFLSFSPEDAGVAGPVVNPVVGKGEVKNNIVVAAVAGAKPVSDVVDEVIDDLGGALSVLGFADEKVGHGGFSGNACLLVAGISGEVSGEVIIQPGFHYPPDGGASGGGGAGLESSKIIGLEDGLGVGGGLNRGGGKKKQTKTEKEEQFFKSGSLERGKGYYHIG